MSRVFFIEGSPLTKSCLSRYSYKIRGTTGVQITFQVPRILDFKAFQAKVRILPWQMNKILIFLIFPVFSGFSSLFTFLHFSLILTYFNISRHIFVINFGKNFGKFQVCTKGKSAIGYSTKTVGRIERGDSTPSAEFMLRISKYFNMLVEDVFHVED